MDFGKIKARTAAASVAAKRKLAGCARKTWAVFKREWLRSNHPRTWRDRFGSVMKYLALTVTLLGLITGSAIDPILRNVIESVGSAVLKVPVKLEAVYFAPLRGKFFLIGLAIGNPEGYQGHNLFQIKRFIVDVDYSYLLKNTVMINEITLEGMHADVEFNWKFDSNIGALLDGMNSGAPDDVAEAAPKAEMKREARAQQEKESEEAAAEDSQMKIVIHQLRISDSRLRVGYAKLSLPVPLPPLSMDDVGESYDLTGAIYNFFSKLGEAIVSIAKAAVKSL